MYGVVVVPGRLLSAWGSVVSMIIELFSAPIAAISIMMQKQLVEEQQGPDKCVWLYCLETDR